VHVPAAWAAFLCFAAVLAASARRLTGGDDRHDRLAQAAAEVGVVLTVLALATGSLWGRPTWGTWWAWDARVATTVAMLLVYLGYLSVRALVDGAHARVVAAVGVGAFPVVPLVHFSVLWWRTLHQPPTVLAPSTSPPLDAAMAAALLTAVVAFTVLTAWTVRRRSRSLAAQRVPARAGAGAETTVS
jgi:heme exporter protein C